MRAAIAWLLLAVETLLTWPIFLLSWLCSAAWLSILGGYQFARLGTDNEKRATLRAMLGEKAKR